jgi:hypothetical protein
MSTTLLQTKVAVVNTVSDIRMVPFTFAATEISLEAITEKGREFFASVFGVGAVSVNLPKSKAPAFAEFAGQKGVTVG